MSYLAIILTAIVVLNGIYITRLAIDLKQHWQDVCESPGNPFLLALSSAVIFFFSSFGICDFAISTVLYRKFKLITDRKLPGTLNTQCVIPVGVMALAFISSIEVNLTTLTLCIISQVLGAYIGPRYVVKFSTSVIRRFIGLGLLIAAFFIVAEKFHWIPSGGLADGLSGGKLAFACVILFLIGAFINVGIGSYAPSMATLYGLGMSPLAAFPIMMGAGAFSVLIGSMQFIKYGLYGRKITLFTSTFGVIGVLIAVYFIKNMNVSLLQWLVLSILLYTSINIIIHEIKASYTPLV